MTLSRFLILAHYVSEFDNPGLEHKALFNDVGFYNLIFSFGGQDSQPPEYSICLAWCVLWGVREAGQGQRTDQEI